MTINEALDHTDAYDSLDALDEEIRNYAIAVIKRDNSHCIIVK